MTHHVCTRARDSSVNGAGDLSSDRHDPREYNFSFSGEASVPRSSAPLYVSSTGSRISHAPQDSRSFNSPDRNHHEDSGNDYTTKIAPLHDTGAALAQAIRALTLCDADNEESSDLQSEARNKKELSGHRDEGPSLDGQGCILGHIQGSSIYVPSTIQSHFSGIVKPSISRRVSTGLVPKDLRGILTMLCTENCPHREHEKEEETDQKALLRSPSPFAKSALHDEPPGDEKYQESDLRCLGTWHSTVSDNPAEFPRSVAGDLFSSDTDSVLPLFDKFKPHFNQYGVERESSSRGQLGQSSSTESNSQWTSQDKTSPGNWKGKRPSRTGGNEDGDDDHDDKRPKMTETSPKAPARNLACPFEKYHPADFSDDSARGRFKPCTKVGFPTIARLKEHLYRRHLNKFTCARCQHTFPDQEQMDAHHREDERCEQRPLMTSAITSVVEKQLRKKTVVLDPELKWYEIYRLIFPSGSLPSSPYHRYDSSERLKEYVEIHLPGAISTSLDPILNAWLCTDEQKSVLKEAIIKCHHRVCVDFQTSQMSDETTPSDSNTSVYEHIESPETPPDFTDQGGMHSLVNVHQYESNSCLVTTYPGADLSSLFLPNYHSVIPSGRPTPVGQRPITPLRHDSYWSDSALGSTSNCDQTNFSKDGGNLAPVSPPSWNTFQSPHMIGFLPEASNAAVHPDNVYDPSLDPFFSVSPAPKLDRFPGLTFHNYCNFPPQHP